VVLAMELFTQLFGHLLAFVYHCFDRIVIHGYLTRLSRPEHVVYFFHEVIGAPANRNSGRPGIGAVRQRPPGGTINVIHYEPSPVFHFGSSVQAGSYGTLTNSNYITGPTTIDGPNYRLDTTVSRADGFRDLGYQDYEIRPEFSWHVGDHTLNFGPDARAISTRHRIPTA
jgi:hypothetical protein